MKAEDRKDLELYAAGRLPVERTEAVERLVFADEDARQFLAQLIGGGTPKTLRSRKSRRSSRHRSSRSRERLRRNLLALSVVVAAGVVATYFISRYLPAPAVPAIRTAAPSVRVAAPPEPPPVFHPPIASKEVELFESANSDPRRPEVAARSRLYRERGSRRRPATDEVLALELANAEPALSGKLEPIAVSSEPRPGAANRHGKGRQPGSPSRVSSPNGPKPPGERKIGGAPGRLP